MKRMAVLLIISLLLLTFCASCQADSGKDRTDAAVAAERFGADGTDSKDDRQALQQALNYARDNATSDRPVTVTLSDGVYYLERSLIIYSHTRFQLSENAVMVFTGQEGLMLFGGATKESYDAVTDVVISGGVWRGNAAATGAHTEPIGFHSASDITLKGLKMEDSSDHFVMLTGVRNAVVTDCTFKDHFPISDINQIYKEALHIDFLPLPGGGMLPSENISVENCRFDNVASGIGTHHYGNGRQEKNISVKNCTFDKVQYHCINAYSMFRLSVTGCTADNCPLFLWCYSTECSILSNTIQGCGEKCLSVNDNSAVLVRNNEIRNISDGSGASTAVISGNSSCVIEDNVISDVDGRAIRIKGGNSMSVVRNNRISNTSAQGIFLLETKASVEGNQVGNTRGIWTEASETSIFDNKLNNCLYGIMLHGGNSHVWGNSVADSKKTGIHITNKEGSDISAVVENNIITGSREDDVRIGKNCVNCIVRNNNPDNRFSMAGSKQSDIVVMHNGKSPLPETPFVSCRVSGNSARLSWQESEGADEYVIYSYDNGMLNELAVTRSLSYDLKDIPENSISRILVVSRSTGGAECFYTFPTNVVEIATGAATGNAAVMDSQKSVSVRPGEQALFRVKAAGSGLCYQWEYRKKGADEWQTWSGRESAVMTAAADDSWDRMQVRCAVTDSSGSTVYSVPTVVSLTGDPAIVMQSSGVDAYSYDPMSFSVTVRGTDYRIRWYHRKTSEKAWTLWKGQESSMVSVTAGKEWNGAKVRCEVTDKQGNKIYSEPITVSVNTKLRIISQPSDKSLRPEEDVTFEVKAVGEGKLQYQWYYKKADAEEWSMWKWHETAATSATANDTWQGMQVKCVITDDSGEIVESRTVNISIYE